MARGAFLFAPLVVAIGWNGLRASEPFVDYFAPAGGGQVIDEVCPAPSSCACCEPDCCSEEKQQELAAAAATAYKDPFYNNDFSYLTDPCYDGWRPGQRLKRMGVGDFAVFDVGGEYRARLHNENNMRGLRLTNRDDDFLLHRTRLFMNAQFGERARAFVEYLDAVSNYEEFAPRLIEENRSDFLNLFGDLVVLDACEAKLTARIGRQELLYGDQRLISPLDWANTRRTFEGAKLMLETEAWNVDGFWTRPVIVDPIHFDSPDQDQEFYGLWSTYKGWEQTALDLYWIGYADYDAPYAASDDLHYQTVGARCLPTRGEWLGLLQGGYQFGSFGDLGHSAGFFVAGLGRKFECVAWKPTAWLFYDWASGDNTIGNGYHHLFPLGHKYFGYMDFFARSNIQDINIQVTATPHEKVNVLLWWHCFFLQDDDDVPYTVTMLPVVETAGGDPYLGQEVDLFANWNVTPYFAVACGYSHFFTGDWYRTNPVARNGFTGDADFVYTQATLRF
jgi:hypothetical protein